MSGLKRFYKEVSVSSNQSSDEAVLYEVLLDGRRLKTPGKQAFIVADQAMAEAAAREWQAQEDFILPETMPCTRLLNVAIEQTPHHRDRLVKEARKYGETDLLCYRASDPQGLVERQAQSWDPVLQTLAAHGINLSVTQSLQAILQPKQSLERIAQYAEALDDIALTLCVHFTALFGSVALALSVQAGLVEATHAFDLSRVDEDWQIEHWGEDADAQARTEGLRQEVRALSQLIRERPLS